MRLTSVVIDGVSYPVEQHTSPNIGGTMVEHRGAVLHIAEGQFRGTIDWQMNPDQRYESGERVRTSSDLVVGKNVGEVASMAPLERVTYTQRDGNGHWKSIEFAGRAGDKLTDWQIKVAAAFLVFLHKQYGVPIQIATSPSGRGLGHHSMGAESGANWGHSRCPGEPIKAQKAEIVKLAQQMLAGTTEENELNADEKRMLRDIHFATVLLKRDAPNQSSGGGVPILPLAKEFYEVDTAVGEVEKRMTAGFALIMQRIDELAADHQDDSPTGGVTGAQIKQLLQEFVDDLRVVSVSDTQ